MQNRMDKGIYIVFNSYLRLVDQVGWDAAMKYDLLTIGIVVTLVIGIAALAKIIALNKKHNKKK